MAIMQFEEYTRKFNEFLLNEGSVPSMFNEVALWIKEANDKVDEMIPDENKEDFYDSLTKKFGSYSTYLVQSKPSADTLFKTGSKIENSKKEKFLDEIESFKLAFDKALIKFG
jgi:hypothetical protein